MTKELIIFLTEEDVSVFEKEESGYENFPIKGEELYAYSDIEEIADYLKGANNISDFAGFELLFFVENKIDFSLKKYNEIFSGASVMLFPMELLKEYFEIVSVRNEALVKKLQDKNKQLTEKIKRMKEDCEEKEKKLLVMNEDETLEKMKNSMYMTLVLYEKNKLPQNYRRAEIKISYSNGEVIKKGYFLGSIVISTKSGEYKYIRLYARAFGNLYWLTNNYSDRIPIKDLLIDDEEFIVPAVIVERKGESVNELANFAKLKIKEEKRGRNG